MTRKLTLPYPPSVNHYWRYCRGMVVPSERGKRYRVDVQAACLEQGLKRMAGPLVVDISLYPPDARRRDVDNALKALLDGMQHGGVYEDDSQIVDLRVRKCGVEPPGRAEVTLAVTKESL